MLVHNPIYKELFKTGYKGRENAYMYWKRNELEFFKHLENHRKDLLQNVDLVKAFHAKIRWRSPIGMLLSFELSRLIPKISAGTRTDLSYVKVEYGKKPYSISDFSELHPVRDNMNVMLETPNGQSNKFTSYSDRTSERPNGTDLRGLGLYALEIKNLNLSKIDFKYATINCSELESVYFESCHMDFMEIRRSELINCGFDEGCVLNYPNFTDTLLDTMFKCSVKDPVISKIRKKDVRKLLIGYNPRWRAFTEVRGKSFGEMIHDESLKKYIIKKTK